jgi:1-acyl-sn-glycerol-3-phosphate acyltransferase
MSQTVLDLPRVQARPFEPIPTFNSVAVDPGKMTRFWKFTRLVCRPIMTLVFDLKVYNRQYVPLQGGVLLVSNHQSYLDPVLIAVYLERQMSYMAKSELFQNKYFAWIIRALHAFPIKQGKSDTRAIKETIKRLKEGYLLNVFPEGARTFTSELGPIEPGAALVIRRAAVPVVPCVIQGSFEAWPRTVKFPKPHPIAVMYGPPLQVEGLKPAEITALIDQTFRRLIDELRRRDPRFRKC